LGIGGGHERAARTSHHLRWHHSPGEVAGWWQGRLLRLKEGHGAGHRAHGAAHAALLLLLLLHHLLHSQVHSCVVHSTVEIPHV
jgi:hypothetical protein